MLALHRTKPENARSAYLSHIRRYPRTRRTTRANRAGRSCSPAQILQLPASFRLLLLLQQIIERGSHPARRLPNLLDPWDFDLLHVGVVHTTHALAPGKP